LRSEGLFAQVRSINIYFKNSKNRNRYISPRAVRKGGGVRKFR